jgi:hypothetical protein
MRTLYVMATITSTPTTLSVTFSPYEKVGGLLRDISLPRAAISSVTVEPDGIKAAKGLRAPGLGLPGLRKIGTWRGRADGRTMRTAVSVRVNQPALRIELSGTSWDQLIIGHDQADRIVADLAPRR